MTRDSMLWTLALLASILTYLAAAPPPTQWTYPEWVQAAAFLVATLSAKLATSPLLSSRDKAWAARGVDRRGPGGGDDAA